jgi:hypothetical protein
MQIPAAAGPFEQQMQASATQAHADPAYAILAF